mgnify:CR=1 FL=1
MLIHIMADGSVRDSVEGVVIQSKPFYEILAAIQQKKRRKK